MYLLNNMLVVFMALLLTACSSIKNVDKEKTENAGATMTDTSIFSKSTDSCEFPLRINQLISGNSPGVFIESIAFQNPCLEVILNYSGCSEGDVSVHWDGRVAEKYPPTITLFIEVENAGDCDQILTRKISVSTAELQKYAGNKFYVRINSFKNTIPVSLID